MAAGSDLEAAQGQQPFDGDEALPLADLARLREETYHLLSMALLYPDEQRLVLVAAAARALRTGAAALNRFTFFVAWRRFRELLEDVKERAPARVGEQYVSLFMAGVAGVPCPPYESSYRDADVAPTGWVLAELDGEYARAGLELAADATEPPDHVSLQLEFMALLSGREAGAWGSESSAGKPGTGVRRFQRQQHEFLQRHLCSWFPAFAASVSTADPGGFYAQLTEAANAFIAHDRDLLGALLDLADSSGRSA